MNNDVSVMEIDNDVSIKYTDSDAKVLLMPVETIQMGFMGLQTYEEVEPVDDN